MPGVRPACPGLPKSNGQAALPLPPQAEVFGDACDVRLCGFVPSSVPVVRPVALGSLPSLASAQLVGDGRIYSKNFWRNRLRVAVVSAFPAFPHLVNLGKTTPGCGRS